MKVALFGGSGGSGKYILKELIRRDYQVSALVRDPKSLHDFKDSKNLKIIIGDALNKEDIESVIKNCDAVISALGQRPKSPKDLLEKSSKLIIEAMKKFGKKRFICLTGAGVYLEGDSPTILDNIITFMIKLFAPDRFHDGEMMVKEVMRSNLDWTIVRTQMQVNSNKGGEENIGMVGSRGHTWRCSRGFIARFMVDNLNTLDFIQKSPAISD